MHSIGAQVVFGAVAAVEEMGEGDGRGSGVVEWAGGEVERQVERGEAVEAVDHRVDLGRVCVVFDLEEHHVLDDGLGGGGGGGGGHVDFGGEARGRGFGETKEGEFGS